MMILQLRIIKNKRNLNYQLNNYMQIINLIMKYQMKNKKLNKKKNNLNNNLNNILIYKPQMKINNINKDKQKFLLNTSQK